jgi:LysR family transcriptional regulator, glycine cleavage system transcriptional activator
MKRGRLPLTSLRSFEAAGRHLSFSRAAEELFVSQAAISRQVRELEALIGQPLFVRLHRRVELTEAGSRLIKSLTASFDEIGRNLSEIIARPPSSTVKVSVEPSFAGEFLIQRLNAFQELHPDIEISVEADSRLVDFRTSDAEIAIRHSSVERSWPPAESRHLLDLMITPVVTPGLLAGGAALISPGDLAGYTLIHDQNKDGWASWFREVGMPTFPMRGPVYADGALAMQAARLGHGIALGDRVLDGDDLLSGRLLAPFDVTAPCGSYWLVAPSFERLSKPAQAFVEWIVDAVATQQRRA